MCFTLKCRKQSIRHLLPNETKLLEQCLIGGDFCTGRNFLHMAGTSDHHRKFHLSSDQGFSGIKIIFVGISDLVSEFPMNIRSFMLLPTEGSRETVSGQTSLTGQAQSSPTEYWSEKRIYWILFEAFSHLRQSFWYTQSDCKHFKHNFNYHILFCALTKFVNKLPMSLIRYSALHSKIFKILNTI